MKAAALKKTHGSLIVVLLAIFSLFTVGIAVSAQASPSHPTKLHLSSLTYSKGRVTLKGWAFRPRDHHPLHVGVTVNGHRVASVVARQRLGKAFDKKYRSGEYHGFTSVVRLSAGKKRVCVGASGAASLCHTFTIGAPPVKPAPTTSPTSALPTPSPTHTLSSTPTVSVTPSPPSSTPPSSSSPSSSTPPPLPATSPVTPEMFGAKGDGITDDTVALQKTFDNAQGAEVMLPAGRTYAHSAVLHLRVAGLTVSGPGRLLATDEQTSSVWIEAPNVTLEGGLVLDTASTTQRWSAWEQMGLRLDSVTGTVLTNITVEHSAAAGIYIGGSDHFTLDHVTVQNTRADGIHMTAGSSYGQVISPTITATGDDGVAVVSYSQDGAPCHDITVTSPVVNSTTGGRGLSVVGGSNITETNVQVSNTAAAGVYVAAEGNPYYTAAPTQVLFRGGSITGANTDSTIDHGSVLVLSGESNVAPSGVTIENLTISNTRASASRDIGVITYGVPPTSILFQDIAINGGPKSGYQGNTPTTAYSLNGVTKNGILLPASG